MALRMYAMYGTKYVRRVIMPIRLNEIYDIFLFMACMANRIY